MGKPQIGDTTAAHFDITQGTIVYGTHWLLAAVLSLVVIGELQADTVPPAPPPASRLPHQRFEADFVAMGMKYHIALYAPDAVTASAAVDAVVQRVQALDRHLSDYNTESELSQLCEFGGPERPIAVSPDLFTILTRSLDLSASTEGAFDVTIGPVIQLWRTARRQKRLPPAAALQLARSRVGCQQIECDPLTRSVLLKQTEMQIDLGGIAAGFALDESARLLRERGLNCMLLEASGDILVGDPPPGRDGWRITVAGLAGKADAPEAHTLTIRNCSVTTSGDARQFVEVDGVRYSHIVDPQTGLGLTRRSSTTVIAPTGWQADSYATAVTVMGSERGLAWLAQQPGCEAVVLEMTPQGLQRTATAGFPK